MPYLRFCGLALVLHLEWCRRNRLWGQRFAFVARIRRWHHAFIETSPLGKGRREIGSFDVPECCRPNLQSSRILLGIRIQGAPVVESGVGDRIGLADSVWCRESQWIEDDLMVELDLTWASEADEYDRVFMLREAEEEILY